MNVDFVEAFGEIDPPADCSGNSFAVNRSGDIVALSNQGKILYSNLRAAPDHGNGNGSRHFKELPVNNLCTEDILSFTNIEFDPDGTLILLWSRHRVGFVEIPIDCIKHGTLNCGAGNHPCSYSELSDIIHPVEESVDHAASIPISKACFHPLCQHLVVVLNEKDLLRMIDLRNMDSQTIFLSIDRKFTSFCFGPAIDWMQFSIFLLTSVGEVYTLCPIVPRGAAVSREAVLQLWSWLDSVVDHSSNPRRGLLRGTSSDAVRNSYVAVAQAFLREMFGARPLNEEGGGAGLSSYMNGRQYVRAGECHGPDYATTAGEGDGSGDSGSDFYGAAFSLPRGGDDSSILSEGRRLLSIYRPQLRGPLHVDSSYVAPQADRAGSQGRRSDYTAAAATEEKLQRNRSTQLGASGAIATDICVPGSATTISYPSTSGGVSAAPVLTVAFSNGDVEFIMLDAQESSPSFAGPSWKAIDLTWPQLSYPLPSLLVTERVRVPSEEALVGFQSATTRGCSGAASGGCWKLIPDPVLSHVVHVYSARSCEAYLLSCHWLARALDSAPGLDSGPTPTTGADIGEAGETGDIDTDIFSPSSCLPTFVLPNVSSEVSGSHSLTESKAAAAGSGGGGASAALSGVVVLRDAMLGHVALFRTTAEGVVGAVNLTVHLKLCALQESMDAHDHLALLQHGDRPDGAATTSADYARSATDGSSGGGGGIGGSNVKAELRRCTNVEEVRWRRAQELIRRVAEGLRDMPKLDSSAALTPQPSAQNKKFLLEAAAKLEQTVLIPLNELGQNTVFSLELLQGELRAQAEVIEGKESSRERGGAATGGAVGVGRGVGRTVSGSEEGEDAYEYNANDPPSLSIGLRRLGVGLLEEQETLVRRVAAIQDRFAQQRERAENLLFLAVNQRSKMTRAEHIYKSQLGGWSQEVTQMNQQVEALRQLSRPVPHITSVRSAGAGGAGTSDGTPSSRTSFMKDSSVSSSRGGASPIGLGAYTGKIAAGPAGAGGFSTPMSQRVGRPGAAGHGPQPGSSSTGRRLYTPGGGTGAGGGAGAGTPGSLPRPPLHSVTSAARSTGVTPLTPQGAGAGGAAGVTSPLAGLPASYARQIRGRSPYQQQHKLQGTAEGTPKRTPADAGAGATPSAGSGNGRQGLSSRGSAAATATVGALTPQDEAACGELLGAQTLLLQQAQQELRELQVRLESIRAIQDTKQY